tara:strand:- start:22 stop:231 length:210 start_codon:yes stop_codon:yes gene_type:complete
MKQCVECGCTPKNDEWAVNSDKHCMDCEQEQNDYYNECMETWNEQGEAFDEEQQEKANHVAKSMDRGEL